MNYLILFRSVLYEQRLTELCAAINSLLDDAFSDEKFLEAAVLVHFLDDIASTDELSFDIELRNGGPVRVLLDSLADGLISQHVHILVVLHTVELKHLHCIVGEAATGHLLATLHEKHDVVSLNPLGELSIELFFSLWCIGLRLSLEV